MKSEYLKRLCGSLGLRAEFVLNTMTPDWWDDDLFGIGSAQAELKLYTERLLGMTWDAMLEPGDGAAALAQTALRAFNPARAQPEFDVPMLGLVDAHTRVSAFYVLMDPGNAAVTVRPVYAVVSNHPRLDADLVTWARATYLQLPIERVSRDVAEFYARVSGARL